jgi:hypothetical protein
MPRYQPPAGIIDPHCLEWGKTLAAIPDDLRIWPPDIERHGEKAIRHVAAKFPEHRVIADLRGCELRSDGKYLVWREVWVGKPGP